MRKHNRELWATLFTHGTLGYSVARAVPVGLLPRQKTF